MVIVQALAQALQLPVFACFEQLVDEVDDGKETDTFALCAGDILALEAGDIVAADARLLEAASLKCIESALTGESETVTKQPATLKQNDTALGDRENMVFMGTSVTAGTGQAVVVATAMKTELGRIACLIEEARAEEKTPLQRKLDSFGRVLLWATLGIVALLFVLGLLRGTPPFELFMTAVSLAVAAVPEGLPAVVTVSLVLDDWGTVSLADEQRRDLFEVLEDRYDRRSTLVASQLPHKHWHETLGDPTLADAILDRLVHNAHKLELKGDSMRKKRTPLNPKANSGT